MAIGRMRGGEVSTYFVLKHCSEAIIAKHQLLLRFTNQQIKSEFSELFFQMVMSGEWVCPLAPTHIIMIICQHLESPVPRQFFIDVGQRHSDDVTKLVSH